MPEIWFSIIGVNGVIQLEGWATVAAAGKVLTPKLGSKVCVQLDSMAGVKFVAGDPAARSLTHGLEQADRFPMRYVS